jgi:hypothetical protein
LSLAPLPSILSLVGQEHGRTIPLTDMRTPFSFSDGPLKSHGTWIKADIEQANVSLCGHQ